MRKNFLKANFGQGILWSKDIKNIDLEGDKIYIIHQVLSYGKINQIKYHFKSINITVNTSDELSFVSLPHEVKISFIYYPYKSLYKTISSDYLSVFDWRDIALDKAHTVGRRGAWRDYVDLFFILKSDFFLKDIIVQSEKKFGDSFSEKLFLSQLVYFDDLEDFTIEFFAKTYSQKDIEEFLEVEVRKINA